MGRKRKCISEITKKHFRKTYLKSTGESSHAPSFIKQNDNENDENENDDNEFDDNEFDDNENSHEESLSNVELETVRFDRETSENFDNLEIENENIGSGYNNSNENYNIQFQSDSLANVQNKITNYICSQSRPSEITIVPPLTNIQDSHTLGYLYDGLKKIVIEDGVDRTTVNRILKLLKPVVPSLPNDYRSYLGTPRETPLIEVNPGKYVHMGIMNGLKFIVERENIKESFMELNFFIDGVAMYQNSEENNFWVILADIEGKSNTIFAIGIYQGISKPECFDNFLQYFVFELKGLIQDSIVIQGKERTLQIKNFSLDTPARASVCGLKGHSGYNSCVRCLCEGEYTNKIIFRHTDCPKRTDESFRERSDKSGFHVRDSLIEKELNLNMISQFPLDFLHVVLSGCVKRFLNVLVGPKKSKFKQGRTVISDALTIANITRPKEIHSKYPSIDKLNTWSGHDFRIFLLKLCPVALKGALPKEYYRHFLFLACAFNILCDNDLHIKLNRTADKFLKEFIECSNDLYDADSILVSMVHQTSHFADEVLQQNMPCDSFSTWRFESFMTPLKKFIKTPNYPLSQLHRRIVETYQCPSSKKCNLEFNRDQKYIDFKGFRIDTKSCKDRFLLIKKDAKDVIVVVLEIIKECDIKLVVRKLKNLPNFFTSPANAIYFNYHYCAPTYDSPKFKISLEEINRKMICIAYEENLFFAPFQCIL